MKLPNGYGSVVKLGGNRRKPYAVKVSYRWPLTTLQSITRDR